MNIHLSSPSFSFNDLGTNIENFSRSFSFWEIISEYKNDITVFKDGLAQILSSYDVGVRVHAPFSDINPASLNPSVRQFSQDRIVENIKVCNEIGIDVVTVHPGFYNPISRFKPGSVPPVNKEFARVLDKAQSEYGVAVGFENMPYKGILDCATLEEYEYVVEGTELLLTFDIGHAFIEGALDDFAKIKERIVNIHIHDNNGEKDQHLILGDGKCDLKNILSQVISGTNKRHNGGIVIESNSFEDAKVSQEKLRSILLDLE